MPEERIEIRGLEQPAVESLAARLAAVAPRAGILSLRGDLGAGKSTFARAFLRSLGVDGTIRSPTYTLIEPYDVDAPDGGPTRLLHLDLYRLADPEELDYLGLRDELDEALLLIEWLEQARGELSADLDLALTGKVEQPSRRDVLLRARTAEGAAWLSRLGDV